MNAYETGHGTATRDRDRAPVVFRCEPVLKEQLVERARQHDRSVGAEIRTLLRAALEREEEDA